MSRNIIIATIFAVIGLIFGLNIQQSPSELVVSPLQNKNDKTLHALGEANLKLLTRVNDLETQQSLEQVAHQSLIKSIEMLKNELEQLSSLKIQETEIPAISTEDPVITDSQTVEVFNDKTQVLTSLGVDESISDRIQEREEKMEMDRLYLRNTAIREGWFGTEKYFEKTQGLSRSTNIYREELGDDNYDRYLFGSNQSNRISVLSVITSSPAEEAGIKKGDIISHYDNEAIFSWSDLTTATTDGEAGQQVSIVIQRDSEEIEFFVPRGPLGIRLENIKVNPNS